MLEFFYNARNRIYIGQVKKILPSLPSPVRTVSILRRQPNDWSQVILKL